jgi:hypothetical protein
MKKPKNLEKSNSSEMDDFIVKVFSKNGNPDYIKFGLATMNEMGLSGMSAELPEVQAGDLVTGVIEAEGFQIRIRFSGKISEITEGSGSFQIGLSFTEEVMLPDVLIARLMAVA